MSPLRRIIITDKKHGLPFSKGLLAKSITAAGISPKQAFHIAEQVENHLRKRQLLTVTSAQLRKIVLQILNAHAGLEKTEKYIKWQTLGQIDKPLIILVGGTTGVGKSTIASETAHRLGINRIVSTDSVREVMRAVFSKEVAPALHESSFGAWKAIRTPIDEKIDPIIAGFMEQTAVVSVGIESIIRRAINENLHMVLEGIHIVPGFLDLSLFENAFVIPLIVTVDDEKVHKSHFYVRSIQTHEQRPHKKYLENFVTIRKIGYYIEGLANKHNVSMIQSYSLDSVILSVLDEIYDKVQSIIALSEKKTVGSEK